MGRSPDTKGNWSQVNKYATHYGLLLGIFWVFRYLFLVVAGAGVSDRFLFLFYLMNIVTLLLMYIFYYRYKNSDREKPGKGLHCVVFMVMMCLYASLLEGTMMYAHFKFIDPAYFLKMSSGSFLNSLPETGLISKDVLVSGKISYIVIQFLRNIFLGFFLGIILNLVIKTKKK
jgi:hypothetical protein